MAGMQVMKPAPKELLSVIDSLKNQVAADRCLFIQVRPCLRLFYLFINFAYESYLHCISTDFYLLPPEKNGRK